MFLSVLFTQSVNTYQYLLIIHSLLETETGCYYVLGIKQWAKGDCFALVELWSTVATMLIKKHTQQAFI